MVAHEPAKICEGLAETGARIGIGYFAPEQADERIARVRARGEGEIA